VRAASLPFARFAAAWILGLALAASAQTPVGGLRGVVRDADQGGTVPGAVLQVVERNVRATTGEGGDFFFADLPPGTYTVTASKAGYERMTRTGVVVPPGGMAEVELGLKAQVTEMDEMVVRELEERDSASDAGLLNIRESSVTMQDAISGELLRRAGASDAAGALKLVVGATVMDGKYASVRGLSDRYVGASLNGIRIPSSDPKRRAVHLDLFPAGTIKNLSVYKTYTPDLPGDYSGGGVNIETIGIPDEPFIKAAFSRESDPLVTGSEEFLSYNGPPMDTWGRHRGARDFPEEADNMEGQGLLAAPSSEHDGAVSEQDPHDEEHETYDRITRGFAPAMGTRRERAGPNWKAGVSLGDRYQIGEGIWGWVGAMNYEHRYQQYDYEETDVTLPPQGTPDTAPTTYDKEVGTEELKYSQIFAAGIGDGEDRQISVFGMRNRVTTDRASIQKTQFNPETDTTLALEQALHYTERSLDTLQFSGKHLLVEPSEALFGLKIDWHAAQNIAEQEEPDVRYFKNVVLADPDGWRHQPLMPNASGAPQDRSTRIWRNTYEENSQLGLDVELPFEFDAADPHGRVEDGTDWGNNEGCIRFGFTRDWTQREYRQQTYFYDFSGQADPLYYGPIYSVPPYKRGSAGRRQYEADVAAWNASPEGQNYAAGQAGATEDRTKGSYVTDTPDELWTDVFLDDDRIGAGPYQNSMYWHIRPRQNDVSYDGEQNLPAGYAMVDFPLTRQCELTLGSRAETTEMIVEPRSDMDELDPLRAYLVPVQNFITNSATGDVTYYYSIAGVTREEARVDILESHWLPAAGLSYELTPGLKLRGSWGRTIARPTFLEMAPIITFDYVEGEALIGNGDLEISEIENYDARLEWMPRDGEVYAFSWFQKDIQDPIEKEAFSYLGVDYLLTVNYPSGEVSGVEAEFRRRLDFLPWPGEHLTLNLNYTRIDSSVVIPDQVKTGLSQHGIDREERDMEGQPEDLFNAGLLFDFEPIGLSASLFYNVRGDTLKSGAAVGDQGARPDIYLLRRGTLNFSITKTIGPHFNIGVKLTNLTEESDEEVYRLEGEPDIPRRTYVDSIKTSFGLWCSF
jgi:TonB-dependent receptor